MRRYPMRHQSMVNYVHSTAIQCRPLNGRHNHRRTGDYHNQRLTDHSAVRGHWPARERLHAEHDRARGQHHQQAGEQGHERIVVADWVLRGVDVATVAGHAATGGSVLSSKERHMARPWAEDRTCL